MIDPEDSFLVGWIVGDLLSTPGRPPPDPDDQRFVVILLVVSGLAAGFLWWAGVL